MRIPSVKTLKLITRNAKTVRAILEITNRDKLTDLLSDDDFPKTVSWLRQCYHQPSFHDLKMSMLDEALETYGVEYCRGRGDSPSFEYCNNGDTYRPTLLFINGSYRVGDWGSIVERGNYE